MTTIYMIRHGESKANEKDVFIGHTDLELTDLGRKQAEITAAYLQETVKPDVIYSSDLKRALHTAQVSARQYGMDVQIDEGIREIYAGEWENVPFAQLYTDRPESFGTWCRDIANGKCDGGESVAEVGARVAAAVRNIALRHPESTVLIFSHAVPIRTFAVQCMGKTTAELDVLPWASNASVTKVEFDGTDFRLVDYSIDHFMGQLATRLPEDV